MSQLDRSKPFAEVHGDDPNVTHRYEQAGKKFDHRGREVGARSQSKPDRAPKADEPEKDVDENPVLSQLKHQLSEV
ncbi:MAG: hypothetical protein E6Q97_25975 [Desulfurellales bacterium]|nr:MAG: hypothetical protein E6Q97_25975 [Desulfurellales bacterium]